MRRPPASSSAMSAFPRETGPMKEPVCGAAAICLKELLSPLFRYWEAAAERSDEDIEYVHQLRVSSRRLAAAFEVFREFLPRRRTKRFERRLALIRKSAGPARDCDVFLTRIAQQPTPELLDPIASLLRTRRGRAQTTLRAIRLELDHGERPEQHASELLARLRARRPSAKRLGGCFDTWGKARARELADRFLDRARPDVSDIRDLHRFRVRVKLFRYSLEMLGPAFDPVAFASVQSSLRKLAKRLGEITDHSTAAETVRQWRKLDHSPDTETLLREWRRRERAELERKSELFDAWWTKKRRRRLRDQLRRLWGPAKSR